MHPPACPITGAAPSRHVQSVGPALLKDLWRIEYGIDTSQTLGKLERLDLWELPTGLYYFHPAIEGDTAFYTGYYAALRRAGHYSPGAIRGALRLAARQIGDGERVLDVGCGIGGFRGLIPQAHYMGLDPHFAGKAGCVRAQSLAEHLVGMAGRYDVACIFDVIEHLSDPALMMRDMARAVRPGGRVVVSVPHVPSAITRIPNFLLNGPPHHLTWWTEASLAAVAAQAALEVERIAAAPWCGTTSKIYWIARCSPVKCRTIFFQHAWSLHLSALIGAGLGLVLDRLLGPPKAGVDEGAGLVLFARKPCGTSGQHALTGDRSGA